MFSCTVPIFLAKSNLLENSLSWPGLTWTSHLPLDSLNNSKSGLISPDKFIFSFGYTGWGPNQLENEIAHNAWEITNANDEILFDTPNNLKINKLSEVSGFDPRIINQTQGSS